MKAESAKAIVEAADEMGLEVTLREDYSGRGMFGKTTAAVVGSRSDITKSIAAAAANLQRDESDDETFNVEQFIEDMDLAWDNMGRDDMVAY